MKKFKEWMLSETVTLSIVGHEDGITTVEELANKVSRSLNNPKITHDQIVSDGDGHSRSEGYINFYVKNLDDKEIKSIIGGIKYFIPEFNARLTGNIVLNSYHDAYANKALGSNEKYKDNNALRVVRFPVKLNNENTKKVEFGIANFHAAVIFRNILHFDDYVQNDYSVSVNELLFKLNSATEQDIQNAQKSVDKDYNIRNTLERIKKFAEYAKANNYDTIYMT